MTTRERLIAFYRNELLENPPVRSLQPDAKEREGVAWGLARKDVDRFERALKRAGLAIVETTNVDR